MGGNEKTYAAEGPMSLRGPRSVLAIPARNILRSVNHHIPTRVVRTGRTGAVAASGTREDDDAANTP